MFCSRPVPSFHRPHPTVVLPLLHRHRLFTRKYSPSAPTTLQSATPSSSHRQWSASTAATRMERRTRMLMTTTKTKMSQHPKHQQLRRLLWKEKMSQKLPMSHQKRSMGLKCHWMEPCRRPESQRNNQRRRRNLPRQPVTHHRHLAHLLVIVLPTLEPHLQLQWPRLPSMPPFQCKLWRLPM